MSFPPGSAWVVGPNPKFMQTATTVAAHPRLVEGDVVYVENPGRDHVLNVIVKKNGALWAIRPADLKPLPLPDRALAVSTAKEILGNATVEEIILLARFLLEED